MESNGCSSAEKSSRHLDIKYFFINDLKEKGLVSIKYCPTEEMVADYMTKTSSWFKIYKISQYDYEPEKSTIIPVIIFNHSDSRSVLSH